jgi:uncharacterized MAPEG superfamily protein
MSIPAAIGLAYLPHLVRVVTLLKYQGVKGYNNRTPREQNLEFDKVFAKNQEVAEFCKRCVGCHLNGMESLSYFAPSVAFAVARGLPNSTITKIAFTYLGLRVVYTVVYLKGSTNTLSYIRTGVFHASVYTSLLLFLIAAK